MNALPESHCKDTTVSATRIESLLKDAASLVVSDPGATRLRLDEISVLLAILQTSRDSQEDLNYFLAPWQKQRIKKYIEEHLDETIRIEVLAGQTRLSASYFYRAFRGTFGVAPHTFIMRHRIDRAMELLIRGDEPIAQIAVACGFADQAHFSRVFSRRAGLPPGAWRRLKRGGVFYPAEMR